MGARWPLAQGGRVGRAGETSAFCPPTQPCRKLVVFMSWGEVRGAHLLSGAEARSSSPREEEKEKQHVTSQRTQAREHKQNLIFQKASWPLLCYNKAGIRYSKK